MNSGQLFNFFMPATSLGQLKPGLTLKARVDNGLWLLGCYVCAQDLCDMPPLRVATDTKCTGTVKSILPASKVLFCRTFAVLHVHGKFNLLVCKMCECHPVSILSKLLDWKHIWVWTLVKLCYHVPVSCTEGPGHTCGLCLPQPWGEEC